MIAGVIAANVTTQKATASMKSMLHHLLNSLHVIVHEDGDEMLDIHIHNRISKDLTRAIEDAIALDSHLTKRTGVRKCCK